MSASAFISDRTDGLGERLRSLTNAIYLANKYDARIFYEWNNRKGRQREYNSIDNEDQVFSREFINAHSSFINESKILNLKKMDFDDFVNLDDHGRLSNIFRISVHQTPLYRYIPEIKEHYVTDGFAAAFQQICFIDQIEKFINHAKSCFLPANATAVHLRAGDIVYGTYNNCARFCGKAMPWQIADAIISEIKSRGDKVVLFGQDGSLLAYLADKHQVCLATSLLGSEAKGPVEMAMQEMVLMSRCSRIVSGSSGFALLASSLAGEIHTNISKLIVSPVEVILSSMSRQVDSGISTEQQIFSLRWLIGMYGHSLPPHELLNVAQCGLALMPDDLFLLVTKASAMNALGFLDDTRKLVSGILSSYSVSELKRIFSPSAFGKPESRAYLIDPILPQIPPSILGR